MRGFNLNQMTSNKTRQFMFSFQVYSNKKKNAQPLGNHQFVLLTQHHKVTLIQLYGQGLTFFMLQYILWGQFLLQGQGLDLWSLRHFCCPTLERLPPSFYLIRHEPMVEEYHQFGSCLIRQKEGGNLSNVEQQKCLRLQRSSPWP